MGRKAAEKLFALTGWTLEQRLASIERIAAELVKENRAGHRCTGADVRQWVAKNLYVCSTVFDAPAPKSLVELNKILLKVSDQPRSRLKNKAMFRKAADYVAAHPGATPCQVKRGIDYDQRKVIARWMASPEFLEAVETARLEAARVRKLGRG